MTQISSVLQKVSSCALFALGVEDGSCLLREYPATLYHSDGSALSYSQLKHLLTSPAHFQLALNRQPPTSDSMTFGTLVHLMVLEPEKLLDEFAIFPGRADGRDASFKLFRNENQELGRLVVDQHTASQAALLAEKVRDTHLRGRPLSRYLEEASVEATIYFREPVTGLRLRSRLDVLHPDLTIDLKTTRFESAAHFKVDALRRHYDMQAAMYTVARRCIHGGAPKPFVIISAQADSPHSVCSFTGSDRFMENGAGKLKYAITLYSACNQTGYWPDLSAEEEIDVEPWLEFKPHRPFASTEVTTLG